MSRAHSTRSPPQRLDSINSSSAPRSPSVRGNHYNKIPDIPNQPLNTPLPITKDGVPHPVPYYITQPIVLKVAPDRPPWKLATKQNERLLLQIWDEDAKFQNKILEELLSDCLSEDISGICSGFLVGAKAKESKDRILLVWLQEEIIEPTVYDEVEDVVYEDLWEKSRTLTDSQFKPLQSVYESKPADDVFLTFLKDHHKRHLNADEGKSIYSHKYGEVIYHLHKIIGKASLAENFAVKKLQEQFITQIAAAVLFQEGVRYMETEMRELDERGRVDSPPRENKSR